jgi:hypothetical protein
MRLLRIFTALILFLLVTIIYISCKKEYSLENISIAGISGGTAIFTLAGAGGNCTNPIINGNYFTGIALASSDTVVLEINVKQTGTFTFSTNIVNGMQFSTSGIFGVTGIQTITAKGTGTPITAGTFPFVIPVGSGCNFFINVVNPSRQTAQYTLQGGPGRCSSFKLSGTYTAGETLADSNTAAVIVNVTEAGPYSITTDNQDGIIFSNSGNFTAIGLQTLILKGSGTPVTAANFTFTPNASSSKCSFSVTVLAAWPPATYILESNPDSSCTGYSVSGNFFAGEALTNTNTMAVKIKVTKLGNYTISTNSVNGITFIHTGSFFTLGNQIVVLTGIGTPTSKGIFSFIPQIIGPHPIGGNTCTANVTVM